jgi:hypothetical protein
MVAVISTESTMENFQDDVAIDDFMEQCDKKGLDINAEKTEEIVVDFSHGRKLTNSLPRTFVGEIPIERVEQFKLVGFILSDDLKPTKHIEACLSKASSRLFLLYRMRSIGIPCQQLRLFFDLSIMSIFDNVVPAYHYAINAAQVKQIEKIQRRARKCLQGASGPAFASSQFRFSGSMKSRREELCTNLFHKYIRLGNALLPPIKPQKNGRSMKVPYWKTNRHGNSFIPAQIRTFNSLNIHNPEIEDRYSAYRRF